MSEYYEDERDFAQEPTCESDTIPPDDSATLAEQVTELQRQVKELQTENAELKERLRPPGYLDVDEYYRDDPLPIDSEDTR